MVVILVFIAALSFLALSDWRAAIAFGYLWLVAGLGSLATGVHPDWSLLTTDEQDEVLYAAIVQRYLRPVEQPEGTQRERSGPRNSEKLRPAVDTLLEQVGFLVRMELLWQINKRVDRALRLKQRGLPVKAQDWP